MEHTCAHQEVFKALKEGYELSVSKPNQGISFQQIYVENSGQDSYLQYYSKIVKAAKNDPLLSEVLEFYASQFYSIKYLFTQPCINALRKSHKLEDIYKVKKDENDRAYISVRDGFASIKADDDSLLPT